MSSARAIRYRRLALATEDKATADYVAQKFRDAGVPIVGDDIKSQVGATIVHRALARLFAPDVDGCYKFGSVHIRPLSRGSGCSSAWPEHCVRDAGVAGSNPVTPISFLPD